MTWFRWLVLALSALLPLVGADAAVARAHPLHTSITELTYHSADHSLRGSIRVFADDFERAVAEAARAKPAAGGAASNPALSYLGTSFSMKGRDGRWVRWKLQGTKREGDLLWFFLHGEMPEGPRGGTVRNNLMFDLFDDQVNIVQITYGGEKRSLLFTRGKGSKRLP